MRHDDIYTCIGRASVVRGLGMNMKELGKVFIAVFENGNKAMREVPFYYIDDLLCVTKHLSGRGYVVTSRACGYSLNNSRPIARASDARKFMDEVKPLTNWCDVTPDKAKTMREVGEKVYEVLSKYKQVRW